MRGSRSATLAVARTRCAAKLTGPPVLGHTLLLGSLGTEETMRGRWHVTREAVERPDAQDRWDRAYRFLLQWSLENEQSGHEQPRAPSANGEEEYHEDGGVRPSLDLQAGQAPDD